MAGQDASFLDFTVENGLVIIGQPETQWADFEGLFIAQIADLKPKAVFYRRYFRNPDDKNTLYRSEPTLVIFSQEDVSPGTENHEKIHKALWSTGQVDVYVLKGETDIAIYNCRKPIGLKVNNNNVPLFQEENSLWANLLLTQGAIDELDKFKFRPQVFGNGTFWEIEQENKRPEEMDSPQYVLLSYLLEIRKNLKNSDLLKVQFPAVIDNLLLVSLLVKFLENISDPDETNTLQKIYAKLKVDRFEEALEQGKMFAVLDELSLQFNGKIFACFEESEREFISQNTNKLNLLVEFLKGGKVNPKTGQYSIWEQFNFRYLPTELISSLYENFIQQEAKAKDGKSEKGIVYTPIFLVDFLVDEAMPIDKPEMLVDDTYKVLDPSCGSGVFLVAAYKRILEWWMLNNKNPDGSFPKLTPKDAQRLLENNIFGVDVKPKAVQISVFSLTTTFLKVLNPKQIWNELRFRDLSENITHAPGPEGFFKWAANKKNDVKEFDLVLGNPPFNPEKDADKSAILKVDLLQTIGIINPLPNNNFALHFFEASMQLAEKVCMILPSNVVLYSKGSQEYRNLLFTNYSVSHIWDFTHLRRVLFKSKTRDGDGADTPVIAILAQTKPSDQKTPIVHTVVRRTQGSEQKVRFEIDTYDRHVVQWNRAVSEDKYFVWKTNLMGGGGLFQFIYRMSQYPTLRTIISSKDKNENWQFKIGYVIGNTSMKLTAEYITNNNYISNFENGILTFKKETSLYFEEPRNKKFFTPPFILFKDIFNSLSKNIIFFDNQNQSPVPFKRNFYCINSDNKVELQKLFNIFKENPNRIFDSYILGTSASVSVQLETYLNKKDVEDLPVLTDFGISESEKIIIDDLLNFYQNFGKSINKKNATHFIYKKTNANDIADFLRHTSTLLNEIYATDQNEWQPGQYLNREDCVICQIGYGPKGKLPIGQMPTEPKNLKSLLEDEYKNRGAIYKRVIRLYDHVDGFDCVYLIKPNAMRYWLKSIALRDASQIVLELQAKDLENA